MSRNVNSRFALNPTNIDIQRSRFRRPHSLKTTLNVGDIVPIYVDTDVLPGDTYSIDTSKVVRMQTLINPIMDNIYLDTYFFFIPHRLVWDHWKEFMGESSDSAWLPEVDYTIPQITPPTQGWSKGTIADYFGVPTGVTGFTMSALPYRAYALVCNEWFRSTPLQDPLVVPTNDTTQQGTNGTNYITDVANGGMPYKACKYHDYFTSALPSPQRGPDVTLPVGFAGAPIPVYTTPAIHSPAYPGATNPNGSELYGYTPSTFESASYPDTQYAAVRYTNDASVSQYPFLRFQPDFPAAGPTSAVAGVMPVNLWGYPDSGSFQAASINQLRMAFQVQRYYERLARGGDRYIEMIKAFFGVTSPDARQQRPEYLGGNRIPININQVLQQSATDSTSPLGATGAYSLTTDSHSDFTRSFTEHGTIIGVMVARYDHTYQQGLERQFSRKTRYDYYFPVFAHLGEQAILNKELYLQSDEVIGDTGKPVNDEVFGFQERWAEYRYKPSQVTGEMRSNYSLSLDSWHLADYYTSQPYLSPEWIVEDANTVDRTIAVSSRVSDQLFADIYFSETVTRPMPLYSVPGLIDHY